MLDGTIGAMTAPVLPLDPGLVLPLHFGGLHPYEHGAGAVRSRSHPFVVLGVVIVVRRRQDAAEGAEAGAAVREPTCRPGVSRRW